MFRFYADPALTTPLEALSLTTMRTGGESQPVAAVVYFGNPTAGRQLTPANGASITVTAIDASTLSGLPQAAVSLALNETGLASATPGAPLGLGASLSSGAANSVPVWVSVAAGSAPVGEYTDLSLMTNSVIED